MLTMDRSHIYIYILNSLLIPSWDYVSQIDNLKFIMGIKSCSFPHFQPKNISQILLILLIKTDNEQGVFWSRYHMPIILKNKNTKYIVYNILNCISQNAFFFLYCGTVIKKVYNIISPNWRLPDLTSYLPGTSQSA